jgi:hypothetical protein
MSSDWSRRRHKERATLLQALAFAAAATEVAGSLPAPAEFSLMGRDAIAEFKRSWLPRYAKPRAYGQWDWEHEILPRYARDLDAFRLAIWSDDVLCGLALGTVTRNRKRVILNFVAGSPDPSHPLKGTILLSAIAAADMYGRGLDASRLDIADPAPGLLKTYQALGFTVAKTVAGATYCSRAI